MSDSSTSKNSLHNQKLRIIGPQIIHIKSSVLKGYFTKLKDTNYIINHWNKQDNHQNQGHLFVHAVVLKLFKAYGTIKIFWIM